MLDLQFKKRVTRAPFCENEAAIRMILIKWAFELGNEANVGKKTTKIIFSESKTGPWKTKIQGKKYL